MNTEYTEVANTYYEREKFNTMEDSLQVENGFVIFLDVLGTKGIWKKKNPESVARTWKKIIERFDDSINSTLDHRARSIALSDSIIITCECNINCIDSIFESLMKPFIYSIEQEFFLRGSISYGRTYHTPQLILGKPIDDATECHDQLEWIGIATTPYLSSYYLSNIGEKATDNYIHYPYIPIKKIEKDHEEIYSPLYYTRKERYCGIALNWYNESEYILGLLINQKNNQSKVEIKCKYENTLAFFDYCREQMDKPI